MAAGPPFFERIGPYDSVQAGAQWALETLRGAKRKPGETGFGVAWENVSWEMAALP